MILTIQVYLIINYFYLLAGLLMNFCNIVRLFYINKIKYLFYIQHFTLV